MSLRRPHYAGTADPTAQRINREISADPTYWFWSFAALWEAGMIIESAARPHLVAYNQWVDDRMAGVPSPSSGTPEFKNHEESLNKMQPLKVAAMLFCMALECRLKALLVQRGEAVPTGKSGHDLACLATKCKLDITADQVSGLRELSLMGQFGRYPVHSNANIMTTYLLGVDQELLDAVNTALAAAESEHERELKP